MSLRKIPVRFDSPIARIFIAASLLIAGTAAAPCQQASPNASSGSGSPGQASASAQRSTESNQSSPSKDNPFPESQSKAAAKADSNDATQTDNPQGESSSSADGYSSSDAQLPAPDIGQGSADSKSKPDSFMRDQTLDGRIEGDLNTAELYMGNGNYRGALLRYQDALQLDPQNDAAQYGVAYAMCKQNLTTEAMARFKSYAKSNPQGRYAVKAEKFLAHPDKCTHNW